MISCNTDVTFCKSNNDTSGGCHSFKFVKDYFFTISLWNFFFAEFTIVCDLTEIVL